MYSILVRYTKRSYIAYNDTYKYTIINGKYTIHIRNIQKYTILYDLYQLFQWVQSTGYDEDCEITRKAVRNYVHELTMSICQVSEKIWWDL